jgi:hypothetical protein
LKSTDQKINWRGMYGVLAKRGYLSYNKRSVLSFLIKTGAVYPCIDA